MFGWDGDDGDVVVSVVVEESVDCCSGEGREADGALGHVADLEGRGKDFASCAWKLDGGEMIRGKVEVRPDVVDNVDGSERAARHFDWSFYYCS